MGGALSASKFYFTGKAEFTRTGYLLHKRTYPAYSAAPDVVETASLRDKVFIVTGANSGLGKELTRYLYSKGATVSMWCRNKERGLAARTEILESVDSAEGHRLQLCAVDCSLKSEIHRAISSFEHDRLDGVVCNAGALGQSLTLTSEGVEKTVATHLLFGTFLLAKLAMPLLSNTPGSRIVVVSSGGMLATKLPSWPVLASLKENAASTFDGQLTYAHCKRAQVLVAEQWSSLFPQSAVKMVSCHPGWVDTPGVASAYGDQASYLQPLRSVWEGTEGIAWLCAVEAAKLQAGDFYLDREPQPKHLDSWWTGSTTNSDQDVQQLLTMLQKSTEINGGVANVQPIVEEDYCC